MSVPQRWWIDHSVDSKVMGLRLTLPVSHGAYLLAGLTTLVSSAGPAAWLIIAYCMHQSRTKKRPIDARKLEEQVILRNPTTPLGDTWHLLRIGHAWGIRKGWRASLLMLVPLGMWIAFTAAGIFVSRVATHSYEASTVLFKPGSCGIARQSTTADGPIKWNTKLSNDTTLARAYRQQCYNGPSQATECNSLINQALNRSASDYPCPWSGNRCVTPNAYRQDTGWIDSHKHLGINAKAADRVQVRLINTCSVISVSDLVRKVPDPTSAPGFAFYQYFLGSIPGVSNYTLQYSNHTPNALVPYTLVPVYHRSGLQTNMGMQVIDALAIEDADLTFVFFAPNSVYYQGPNNDPFFSASGNYTREDDGAILPDYYVRVMACSDQKQIRNPVNNVTSDPGGFAQMKWSGMGMNDVQNATMIRLWNALFTIDTYNTVFGQNSAALQATAKVVNFQSAQLPDTQYQIELRGWFETSLARFQRAVVDYVGSSWESIIAPSPSKNPVDNALYKQCSAQLSRSLANYQSFSVFGVFVIVASCLTLVILALILSLLVRCCTKRIESRRHRYDADVAHGKLFLARLALEAEGVADWKTQQKGFSDYPVRLSAQPDIDIAEHNNHIRFVVGPAASESEMESVSRPPTRPLDVPSGSTLNESQRLLLSRDASRSSTLPSTTRRY